MWFRYGGKAPPTQTPNEVNRVEPRESNSRPVLGENFLLKEVAMTTDDTTITRQRLGDWA